MENVVELLWLWEDCTLKEKPNCLTVILQKCSIEMYQPVMHVVACALDLKEVAMDAISDVKLVNEDS